DADLLLHVVDGSEPAPEEQVQAVREVLAEIGSKRAEALPPELIVINKSDASDEVSLARLRHLLPEAHVGSAHTRQGVPELVATLSERLPRPGTVVAVLVPYARGDLVARAHAHGEALSEQPTPSGTRLCPRVRADVAAALAPYRMRAEAVGDPVV